jgi:hypothetical protein
MINKNIQITSGPLSSDHIKKRKINEINEDNEKQNIEFIIENKKEENGNYFKNTYKKKVK